VGCLMHLMRTQEMAQILGRRTMDDPEFKKTTIEHWVEIFTTGIFTNRSLVK